MTDWRDEALCAQVGGDLWFPYQGGSIKKPKRICGDCPVRIECLEDALATEDFEVGIRGGLTPAERLALFEGRKEEEAA